jgi:thioredoxin 1
MVPKRGYSLGKKPENKKFGLESRVREKAMSELVPANDLNFDNLLNDNKAVIVDFSSPTCAPCRQIEPWLQKIAANHPANVKIIKVNVNESPKTSARYLIRSVPTLLFVKNGSVKSQIIGTVNGTHIEEKLKEIL